ncbi:hypothetical protein Syun_019306 [Stephania yunnanensis]|uniref:Uncharacterized protein n=1 Tax=Stephania yunnanensis TaxID=152371 RepID=A0AAP0NX70_9MAGN
MCVDILKEQVSMSFALVIFIHCGRSNKDDCTAFSESPIYVEFWRLESLLNIRWILFLVIKLNSFCAYL